MIENTELNKIVHMFVRHVELHSIKFDAHKKQLAFELALTADTTVEA